MLLGLRGAKRGRRGNGPPRGEFTINYDSPQAQGLVFWAPLWGVSRHTDSPIDLVNNVPLAPQSASMAGLWEFEPEVGDYTPAISLAFGNQGYDSPTNLVMDDTSPFAIFCWSEESTGIAASWNGGTSDWLYLRWVNTSNGLMVNGRRNNAEDFFYANTNYAGGGRKTHIGAAVTTSGATGTCVAYYNGRSDGSKSNQQHPDGADKMSVLHRHAGAFEHLGRVWDVRLYFNRVLRDQDVWEMYDPATRWDLYYELGRKTYFLPSATADPTPLRSLMGVGS